MEQELQESIYLGSWSPTLATESAAADARMGHGASRSLQLVTFQ